MLGDTACLIVSKIDFAMTPRRSNLMPPAVLPAEPPTAMMSAIVRKAPDERAVVSCVWFIIVSPVVVKLLMIVKTPRWMRIGNDEKTVLDNAEAVKIDVMITSQTIAVFTSMSSKNTLGRPRKIQYINVKLIDPRSIASMQTHSIASEL